MDGVSGRGDECIRMAGAPELCTPDTLLPPVTSGTHPADKLVRPNHIDVNEVLAPFLRYAGKSTAAAATTSTGKVRTCARDFITLDNSPLPWVPTLTINQHSPLHVGAEEPWRNALDKTPISNQSSMFGLSTTTAASVIASEEEDTPVAVEETYNGNYVVVFDPLDGSSNIDCCVSVGSIFGVYRVAPTLGSGESDGVAQCTQPACWIPMVPSCWPEKMSVVTMRSTRWWADSCWIGRFRRRDGRWSLVAAPVSNSCTRPGRPVSARSLP